MDRDRAVELGLEAAEWLGGKIQEHINRVDRSVEDAWGRAEKLEERTSGSRFAAFGKQRLQNAQQLADDPPHKFASALKLGAMAVSGALLLYSSLKRKG